MKTRICLCVLAALLMIPVAVTAQTKKTKKEVAIQLYSVRDILNRVDNKDGKCDPAYTAILAKLAKMGYTGVEAANYNNGKRNWLPVIIQNHLNGGISVSPTIRQQE